MTFHTCYWKRHQPCLVLHTTVWLGCFPAVPWTTMGKSMRKADWSLDTTWYQPTNQRCSLIRHGCQRGDSKMSPGRYQTECRDWAVCHYLLNLIRAHATLSLQNSDTRMHILCPLSCRGLIIVVTRRGHSPTFSLIKRVGKVWWYTGWTPRIIILAKVWPSWSNFGQYNDTGC